MQLLLRHRELIRSLSNDQIANHLPDNSLKKSLSFFYLETQYLMKKYIYCSQITVIYSVDLISFKHNDLKLDPNKMLE